MAIRVRPMGMLLMMLSGWVNRYQQDVITYLKEENKILREKLGTKRTLLNDNQRMRLARLAKRLGRAVLADAWCALWPDTLLKWHRTLVARKNKTWGSRRIQGQLKYLGHNVCHTTIDNVLTRALATRSSNRLHRGRAKSSAGSDWADS